MTTYYFDVYVDEFRSSRRLYYDGVFNGNPNKEHHEMAYTEENGPKPAKIIGCHPPGEQPVHKHRVFYVDADNVTSSAVHRATYRYTTYVKPFDPSKSNVQMVEHAYPVPVASAANRPPAHPKSSFVMESCSDILMKEAERMKRKLEEYMEEDRRGIKYLKELEKKLDAMRFGPSAAKKIKSEPVLNGDVKPGSSKMTFEGVVELETIKGIENMHIPMHQQRRRPVTRNSKR